MTTNKTIEGLKKRLKSLENKIKRARDSMIYYGEQYDEAKKTVSDLEEETKGLREILNPYLVAEKL